MHSMDRPHSVADMPAVLLTPSLLSPTPSPSASPAGFSSDHAQSRSTHHAAHAHNSHVRTSLLHAPESEDSDSTDESNDLEAGSRGDDRNKADGGLVVCGVRISTRVLTLVSWLAMLGSMMSMSASGPLFLFVQRRGVAPILACAWRCQFTTAFLLLPALIEWRLLAPADKKWRQWRVAGSGSGSKADLSPSRTSAKVARLAVLPAGQQPGHVGPSSSPSTTASSQDWHVIWYILGVSVVWSCSLTLWTSALRVTSTARASLLSSTYPILLALWLKFGPEHVSISRGEVIGVMVSFLGIATSEAASMAEHAAHASWHDSELMMAGDALCVASAVFIAADILISKKAREVCPVFLYTLLTTAFTLLILTLLSLMLEDTQLFSMHEHHGVFAWLNPSAEGRKLLKLNAAAGAIEAAVGLLGFNFALKYVPELVFSSAQLFESAMTGLLSWAAGLEAAPSRATYLGLVVVGIGVGMVVTAQAKREAAEQAQSPKGRKQMTEGGKQRGEYAMINLHDKSLTHNA